MLSDVSTESGITLTKSVGEGEEPKQRTEKVRDLLLENIIKTVWDTYRVRGSKNVFNNFLTTFSTLSNSNTFST